ncbi:MAG: hypothetical protein ACRC80_14390, partial [Waterburya sp.]
SLELSANSERAYQRSLSRFLKWTDKGWHLLKHQDLDRYKEYLKELEGASHFLTKHKYSKRCLYSNLYSNRYTEASTFEIRFLDSIVRQQS